MAKQLSIIVLVIAVFASGIYLGLRNPKFFGWSEPAPPRPSESVPKIEYIVAQGRILPFGGLVSIPAPPGQRIDKLLVGVGDLVVAGQTELATLAGRDLLELQVQMAAAKRSDAELEIDQRIVAAEINLRAAQAARETAKLNVEQAHAQADHAIADKQIAAAQEKLERMKRMAEDPLTKNLVSQQDIADQQIALEKAQDDLVRGDDAVRRAQETADLALRNAELNIESAQRSLELANKMRSGNQSLTLAETVAQAQLENSRLIAPSDGNVLKVYVKPGEAAVNSPLMQIGDLSRMECVAEVNDRIVRQVHIGQRATIKSPALSRDLVGTVRQISRVVGNNTLPNPNPLALVDTKTVDVHIELDSADAGEAASFVNLQVTVEIDPGTTPADQPGSVARASGQR